MNSTNHYLQIGTQPRWNPTLRPQGCSASNRRFSPEDGPVGSGPKIETWKRVLDLACLVFGFPGILLLMVLIAGLIKLVSPGPVFFKQERIGLRRNRFICFKFRTMKAGVSPAGHQQHLQHLIQSDAPLVKMDALGDPRLIPGGRYLRAAGLDELPQLLNVWRGEMSLVGPRPCTPYELDNFHPSQYVRFDTLPGLTGLWQVKGKNKTTFSQMIQLDTDYVRNKSLWLDARILLATGAALVSQIRDLRGPALNASGRGPKHIHGRA